MSTRRTGDLGEQLAADYLTGLGFAVLERNWRCAQGDVRGELDLVAREGPVLVFCEVKARRGVLAGAPLEAVTRDKAVRLRRLAAAYLARTGTRADQVRFDVVGVWWRGQPGDPQISHLRGVC